MARTMFVVINPGSMGDPDLEGKPEVFKDSLAEAIEDAFNDLLEADGMDELPVENNLPETRDRRRLFVALAKGIVDYLDGREVRFTFDSRTRVPTNQTMTIEIHPPP